MIKKIIFLFKYRFFYSPSNATHPNKKSSSIIKKNQK